MDRESTSRPGFSNDTAVRDLWHVIGHMSVLRRNRVTWTSLLGVNIVITVQSDLDVAVSVEKTGSGESPDLRPTLIRFGFLWTSLGEPPGDIFSIEESEEQDRRNFLGAIVGIHVSAPRAIENFLDMAHFPFVHSNTLGTEEQTGVMPYKVEVTADGSEIWARECSFFQPVAAATADKADVVNYIYRVPHPYCSILYKTNPIQQDRNDIIGLFLQPTSEDRVIAYFFLSLLDETNSDADIRKFQQGILAQDKPILENEIPRKLPLDPRAEVSIPADLMSNLYRRWLSERDVRYGTISARRSSGADEPVETAPSRTSHWFPVASVDDLVVGHIFHGELFGQELALWKADDGTINVWENRCPHRGMRLTIGQASGLHLRCRYHGLVFRSGGGDCVAVPAHPDRAPSRGLRVKSYASREHAGHIWTTLQTPPPDWDGGGPLQSCTVLRAMPIDVPAVRFTQTFLHLPGPFRMTQRDAISFGMALDHRGPEAVLWVQPASAERSIVRGVLLGALDAGQKMSALKTFNEHFRLIKERLENSGAPIGGSA